MMRRLEDLTVTAAWEAEKRQTMAQPYCPNCSALIEGVKVELLEGDPVVVDGQAWATHSAGITAMVKPCRCNVPIADLQRVA